MSNKEEIFNQLKEILKSGIRERTKIDLNVGDYIEESSEMSQMFGEAYFEEGESWPMNPENGKPLEFIFQIWNSKEIFMPDEIALFQVFIDPTNVPVAETDPGICIKARSSVNTNRQITIAKPYEEAKPVTVQMEYSTTPSLPDNEDRDDRIFPLLRALENDDPELDTFELLEDLYYEMGVPELGYSGIGGYPHWTQGSEIPGEMEDKPWNFLLEIHGGFKWNFMVGLYFFSNPEDPLDLKFVHQFT